MNTENYVTAISDEFMREMLTRAKEYCVVILHAGPNKHMDGADKLIWEHGRRNFALRADEILSIVCPVRDGGDISGIGIFNAPIDVVTKIMDDDPGVQAGIFVYEIHTCRSFPGDSLPA